MKRIIAGEIIDTYLTEKKEITNFIFLTKINGYDIYWAIEKRFFNFHETPEFDSDSADIIWDNKKYKAKLKISANKFANLERYFDQDIEIDDKKLEKIEVVKCPSCGSNVSIGKNKNIVCDSCSFHFDLSDYQYKNVIIAKKIEENNKNLYKDLYKSFKVKKYKFLGFIPYFLLLIQLLFIGYYNILPRNAISTHLGSHFIVELMNHNNFSLKVVLPSFLITVLIFFFLRKNAFHKNIINLFSIFSPVIYDDKIIHCRNCGAPLEYTKMPDVLVCPYCKSENVIIPKSIKKIDNKLNFSILDAKIFYNKFKISVNRFYFSLLTGITVFYGFYFIYSLFLSHVERIAFLVRIIVIPFVVFVLLFILLYRFATLPESPEYDVLDLLPSKITEKIKNNNHHSIKKYTLTVYYSGLIIYFFFVISQFLVKAHILS